MADDAPTVDDLMAQARALRGGVQGAATGAPGSSQAPSADDLLAQTRAVVPARTAAPQTPQQPPTTPLGVAKNAAAAGQDITAGILNTAADPTYNLLMHPLVVAGGTAFDAVAHALGYAGMSPEQRADLYGMPQPGQTQLPPEQQQIGTRVVNALDAAIPGPQATNLPASPAEAAVRRGVAGAGTMAALGPGGLVPIVAGGVASAAAPEVAKNVPDWLQPGTEMAVNALAPGGAAALEARFRPGSAVQPTDAATAQLARSKYQIPIDATDITPGSTFRTPESVQAKTAAWQGKLVEELGENPNTPDVLSRNQITNKVMTDTAARSGKVMDDVANRTDIGQLQTYGAVTKLAAIDHSLDLEAISDAQKSAIRRNIDLVQDAAAKGNGVISGKDYQDLTKTDTPLDRLASNSDPNVAAIGMQIKSALDDAFQKSASPADQAALTQARYQWRLMKTLQPLVERAQGGNIDPGQFMTRAIAASRKLDGSTGGMAYTGGGNIGELARIGDLIKRGPTPTASSLLGDVFNPAGGGLPYYINPKMAAAAHVAQVVGKQVAGPYLRSGFNAQRVIQNALQPPTAGGAFLQGAYAGALQPPS
jgi:hypothetical protein